MKAARSRSTTSPLAWTPRVSRTPRVTIAVILEADGDVETCWARLTSQCERSGMFGIIVSAGATSVDDTALGRRVRVIVGPADASRAELRHLAMQHADGDIVLLEDGTTGGMRSQASAYTVRDLADRARACPPISEWRDILRAHGIGRVGATRPSPRGLTRVDPRPVRETAPMMADAQRPA